MNQKFGSLNQKVHMNKLQTLCWEDIKLNYYIDEQFGVGFDQQDVKLDSYYDTWLNFIANLPKKIQSKQVDLNTLPYMNLDYLRSIKEYMFIYSILSIIDYPNVPQILPNHISVPFYLVCQKLKIKPGLSANSQLCNWKLNDQQGNIYDYKNFIIRNTFTENKGEQVFYLLGTIGDNLLGKVLQLGFKANIVILNFLKQEIAKMSDQEKKQFDEIEEQKILSNNLNQMDKEVLDNLMKNEKQIDKEINDLFQQISKLVEKLCLSLKEMYEYNDPNFFYNDLRIFLQGYSNVELFKQGLYFEGINVYRKDEGASQGNSPSYQVFERLMGIRYEGPLDDIQKCMRQSMFGVHLELIDLLERHSFLRFYSLVSKDQEIRKSYNQIIQQYINFNNKHNNYVQYYIEQQIVKANPNINLNELKGTGNQPLKTIKQRSSYLHKFIIE